MFEDLREKLQRALLVLALSLTCLVAAPAVVTAQEEAATETADAVSDVVEDEDDDGFDWGLLGLLGLLGLGGLFRRNEPEVRTTERVDRPVDTTIR